VVEIGEARIVAKQETVAFEMKVVYNYSETEDFDFEISDTVSEN
jgi:hypothetical protein